MVCMLLNRLLTTQCLTPSKIVVTYFTTLLSYVKVQYIRNEYYALQ